MNPNCSIYNLSEQCVDCITGFQFVVSLGKCISNMYCQDSSCVQCQQGFVISNSVCIPEFCQTPLDNAQCSVCSTSYFLVTITTYQGCISQTDMIDNCTTYDLSKNCTQCLSGYQITSFTPQCVDK